MHESDDVRKSVDGAPLLNNHLSWMELQSVPCEPKAVQLFTRGLPLCSLRLQQSLMPHSAMQIYRVRPHVRVKPSASMASFVAELQSTNCKHNLATELEPVEVTKFRQISAAGRLSLC